MTKKNTKSKAEEEREKRKMRNKKTHQNKSPRHIKYVAIQAKKAKDKKPQHEIDVKQAVERKKLIR